MAKRGGFPGGGMPGNMANLMKQAQKMQRQMEEQAKEMETKNLQQQQVAELWRQQFPVQKTCETETG